MESITVATFEAQNVKSKQAAYELVEKVWGFDVRQVALNPAEPKKNKAIKDVIRLISEKWTS